MEFPDSVEENESDPETSRSATGSEDGTGSDTDNPEGSKNANFY